ncbi:MAG: O-antigen ligase family protein [Candidatus Omnitrophota bacterium]
MKKLKLKINIDWENIITGLFVISLACFSAAIIPALVYYEGMGAFLMRVVPVAAITGIYILYKYSARLFAADVFTDFKQLCNWQYVSILLVTVTAWLIVSSLLPPGLVPGVFGCFSFLGIVAFSLLLLINKKVYALIALLMSLPFIRFLELQSMYMSFAGFLMTPFIITPSNIAIGIFAFFYVIVKITNRENISLINDTGNKYYLIFAVACLFSTLYAWDISVSFIGFIIEVIVFPLFFLFVKDACREKRFIILLFYSITIAMTIRILITLYMAVRHKILIDSLTTAVSQIEVITTLSTMLLPLLFGLFLLSRYKWTKLFVLLLLLAPITGIVFGDKREPIIALVATLPFVFLLPIKFKKAIFLGGISVGLSLLLYYGAQSERHIAAIPLTWNALQTDSIRMCAYKAALGIIKDYPLFGVGFGNYVKFLDFYSPRTFYMFNVWPLVSPHNFILHYLSSVGIVASGALFLLIGYTYKIGAKVIKKANDKVLKIVLISVLWSISCFLAAANTGGTMVPFAYSENLIQLRIVHYIPDIGIFFWLFMGFIYCIYVEVKKEWE